MAASRICHLLVALYSPSLTTIATKKKTREREIIKTNFETLFTIIPWRFRGLLYPSLSRARTHEYFSLHSVEWAVVCDRFRIWQETVVPNHYYYPLNLPVNFNGILFESSQRYCLVQMREIFNEYLRIFPTTMCTSKWNKITKKCSRAVFDWFDLINWNELVIICGAHNAPPRNDDETANGKLIMPRRFHPKTTRRFSKYIFSPIWMTNKAAAISYLHNRLTGWLAGFATYTHTT